MDRLQSYIRLLLRRVPLALMESASSYLSIKLPALRSHDGTRLLKMGFNPFCHHSYLSPQQSGGIFYIFHYLAS
jgi:hypothetical protein